MVAKATDPDRPSRRARPRHAVCKSMRMSPVSSPPHGNHAAFHAIPAQLHDQPLWFAAETDCATCRLESSALPRLRCSCCDRPVCRECRVFIPTIAEVWCPTCAPSGSASW